jgi:ketosteroid isomerase-like protein
MQTNQNSEVEQEIRTLERKWDEAQLHHDTTALDRIMADDFIAIVRGESHVKNEVIESYKSPDVQYEFHESIPDLVRIYGNTVIVVGHAALKGQYKGQGISAQAQYSRVYVRREEQWQLVLAHATLLDQK